MSDEGFETFEVSPTEQPDTKPAEQPAASKTEQQSQSQPQSNDMSENVEKANGKCLHVTIVDHNPVIEGTDDSSYIDMRIPLAMVETGLKYIPGKKLGDIDPDMIVQMIQMGASGELIKINEEKKTISIRVE